MVLRNAIFFVKVGTNWVQNIILIGMPGSGKSTVGVLLAKALGYGFLDVDLLLQRQESALLQDILDTRGLEAFLDAEERAVCSVRCEGHVIAPGGSAVCRERAALHLKSLGPVVYLDVPLDELNGRIQNLSTRGIAMEPGQSLADVMACRTPLYRKYADLVISCSGGHSLAQTAQTVLERLRAASLVR
ncbi:MAG: shikimate kinase [Lawsonibacter sp.]